MAYGDLREYVKRLEREGELKRVKTEVDPVLEIAEIVQRAQALPGPREIRVESRCCLKSAKARGTRRLGPATGPPFWMMNWT